MASVTRWMAGLGLTAAVLAAEAMSPALAAEFKVGSWVGHDVVKEGKFLGCEIYSPYPNGQGLAFGISGRGIFEIRVSNGTWNLQPGKVQVSLWVDDLPKLSGNALAAAKDSIIAPVPEGGKKFADAIKKGNVLHVSTPSGDIDFKLTGTSKALTELEKCWERGMGTAQAPGGKPAAAAAAPPKPGKPVKGSALLGLPIQEFAMQVLSSGDKGYFTVERADPKLLEKWNAALLWSMKDGFGLITGVNSDPDVEALKETLVRQKQPKCKGNLTSASDVRTLTGTSITVKRVEVRCSDVGNGEDVSEVFSFYPHLSGKLLAVSHVSKNRQVAADGDAEFAKRVAAILKAK